jgi:hypothetical protein
MPIRLFRALAAAILLIGLTLGGVAAGGWATINADASNTPQPKAGEPFTFGFTVLQHGVTPAGWVETPTFVGIDTTTGQRIEAKASGQGADGHFVATVTLPSSGFWTWQVVLTDLIVETPPTALVVATASGKMPTVGTADMLAALERMRSEVRTDYEARIATQDEQLRGEISKLSTQITWLQDQRDELNKKVTQLASTPTVAAPAPDGLPLIGVISVAVLAGAIAGFAMAALGRGQAPAVGPSGGSIDDMAPSAGALSPR